MSSSASFYEFFASYVPVGVIALISLVSGLILYRRHRTSGILLIVASGLQVGNCILPQTLFEKLLQFGEARGWSHSTIFATWTLAVSVPHLLTHVLIVWAVFAGRSRLAASTGFPLYPASNPNDPPPYPPAGMPPIPSALPPACQHRL